jgi:hypothetical protein
MGKKEQPLFDTENSQTPPFGYTNFLSDLKTKIYAAQLKAAVSVNREMILLYWEVGKGII